MVLDIGCAMGYSTAIIARLAGTAVGLEEREDLFAPAQAALEALEVDNAVIAKGALTGGYPAQAPYDAILIHGAVEMALARHPLLNQARLAEEAAREGVDLAIGEMLPEVRLVGRVSRNFTPTVTLEKQRIESVQAQVSIPLYQSGAVQSRVRQSKQLVAERRAAVDNGLRIARANAIAAWEALMEARARIAAFEAQVEANRIALDGVKQEAMVGARTTLDILDAEQEFLDAQVDLVSANRDEKLASFELLAAAGGLSARALSLPVAYYDPQAHYRAVENKLFGVSADP